MKVAILIYKFPLRYLAVAITICILRKSQAFIYFTLPVLMDMGPIKGLIIILKD